MKYRTFFIISLIKSFIALQCMHTSNAPLRIKQWNTNILNTISENPHLLSTQDEHGNTALHHVLTTLTYHDDNTSCIRTALIRTYSYNPDLMIKLMQNSDLNIKNKDGRTAFDVLLEKLGTGYFHAAYFLGTYYVFNQENSINTQLCMPYSLIMKLIHAARNSGYDFKKNPQTTFKLLGQNFSVVLYSCIKELFRMGMPIKNIEQFCTEKNVVLYLQSRDYDSIDPEKKLSDIFNTISSSLSKSNDMEDRTLFSDMFIRVIADNNKKGLKNFAALNTDKFSPLKALELAIDYNGYEVIPYILRSFNKKTLVNLYTKINNKKLPYTSTGFDKKLYALYEKAKQVGNHRFCSSVNNYTSAVTAFMGTKNQNYKMCPCVERIILEYSL